MKKPTLTVLISALLIAGCSRELHVRRVYFERSERNDASGTLVTNYSFPAKEVEALAAKGYRIVVVDEEHRMVTMQR